MDRYVTGLTERHYGAAKRRAGAWRNLPRRVTFRRRAGHRFRKEARMSTVKQTSASKARIIPKHISLPGQPDSQAVEKLLRQYGCGPIQFAGADHGLYDRHLLFDNVIDP